ncbi:MAG TPA: M20/M25/M40 family metallo-hydrolase, partial [Chloroflexota bacterium]|nr:M20/M25/M40 family metallo-hydrolase [Chloroflexota bacterium]
ADLILAVTAGEEVDMAGARLMAAGEVLAGTASLVIGEPTGLAVYRAEKGVFWVRVTAHGRTAHGSMPQLGVNAISFMARLIPRLEAYPFAFVESEILGKPTLSVNTIAGGVKTNVVADRCAIEIDMRLVPGQTPDDVLQLLQAIIDEVAADPQVRTTVEILQDVPPVETPASDRLVEVALEAARNAGSAAPDAGGVSFGTDGAILALALGASMVIFGPGGLDQLHQPNEYVEIAQLHLAVEAYKQIARRMLTA